MATGRSGFDLRGHPRAALIEARKEGATLREAAARAGVHLATVCRWMRTAADFREDMAEARQALYRRSEVELQLDLPARKRVRWRTDCPACRAKVVVRCARGRAWFWRCGRWPHCGWASWRPRHPRDCPKCKAARYWSHSRKSIVCGGCGVRTRSP